MFSHKKKSPPPPPRLPLYFEVSWDNGYRLDVVNGYSSMDYGPYLSKQRAIRAGRKKVEKIALSRKRADEECYREYYGDGWA